ncbi:hypothetical protein DSO57_1028931 [Entomophthora muscae]|uniref:Uncharacterized protein n=1 Tax=Entomophthora muscae TaxID=34485 RepID=A0ACC2UAP9_9FUNG|nr:hypothetical protein DSO57_1028931 [Entomophthora muscae]
MEMEKAVKLFDQLAKLVFLDAPHSIEFGIDFNAWTTGANFKGVKFIPPGIHFVYYSATDKQGNTGIRSGFFHDFKPSEVLVKKWNPETEDLFKSSEMDVELCERIRLDIRNFDKFMGPYPIDPPELMNKWRGAIQHVSPQLVLRILAKDGMMEGFHPVPNGPTLEEFEGSMKFTPFDLKRSFPPGVSGVELTKHVLDKSYLLTTLLHEFFQDDASALLGELELAFVTFLLGQNFCGLEQWKKLIILLCNCQEAIDKNAQLFVGFLVVIERQLRECPTDFFVDVLLQENFLAASLQQFSRHIFQRALKSPNANVSSLASHLKVLQKKLLKKFGWELDLDAAHSDSEEEEGEYAPVIVE